VNLHNTINNGVQTEGSIYLLGTIVQSAQDLLMRLQSRMADVVQSPGNLPFNKYRGYKNEKREAEEPYRFVDGDLIERFLDVSETLQEEICRGLGPGVEEVRNFVEELKRLH
jgi:DNA damage-binding protein 1